MRWDFVAESIGVSLCVGHPLQMDSSIQLVTLTSLNEEQLRLASQGRAVLGIEVSPESYFNDNVTQKLQQ